MLQEVLKRLDERDDELERVKDKLRGFEQDDRWRREWVRNSWTIHQDVEELGLPVPRLQFRWLEAGARRWACYYELVYRHLLGDVIGVPLGYTTVTCRQTPELSNGNLDMPFRDSAHAKSDAEQLGLEIYVVFGEQVRRAWWEFFEHGWDWKQEEVAK
jgi:hypothetical protein